MKVLLDTNCLYTTRAGTARYTQGLLDGFASLQADDLEIQPLGWPVYNLGYRQPLRALKTAYREGIWNRTHATWQLRSARADLFHSASHLDFKPQPGLRRVHTLYDLVILRHPQKFRPWQRHAGRRFLKQLPAMDRILCISRFTADEAMRLLGIPSRRLEVVYCGSDLAGRVGENSDDVRLEDGMPLPEAFFLFVGSLEPGKNLGLLREVYHQAEAAGIPLLPLLIAGARWEGVAREGVAPSAWRYLGRVDDRLLAALYRRATALVFPSKYEGFGLPVLEAMSLGCPVICSRAGSLPEVGGDAVMYAELEALSFLRAMQALPSDTARREDCVARGLARAHRFTWHRCAEETLAVYRDVLGDA